MRALLKGTLQGIGLGAGLLLVLALTALTAQTFHTFQPGDLISASAVNQTLTYLRNRVDNPLPGVTSGSSVWSTTDTNWQDATGLSVTVTTSGSPVWLGLVSDGSGAASFLGIGDGTHNDCAGEFRLVRDGVEIAAYQMRGYSGDTPDRPYEITHSPPGAIWHIDRPNSGTYVYKIQARRVGSTTSCGIGCSNCKLTAARFNEP